MRAAGPSWARLRVTAAAAFFALSADQALKAWMLIGLDLPERLAIDVLPPYLRLLMAWNTGVNFGLGAGAGAGLWIALALAVCAGVAWWSRSMPSPLRRTLAGLVIGGALGNALDRALHGAVVDFLNMSCCGFVNPYAFNLADVFIFAGAIGLILLDGRDNQRA